MGRDTHQEPSPELTRVLVHAVRSAFVTSGLAFVFSANHDPERWRPLHETPGASCAAVFTTDGKEIGIFCQDARGVAPIAWFEEQFEKLAPRAPRAVAPL